MVLRQGLLVQHEVRRGMSWNPTRRSWLPPGAACGSPPPLPSKPPPTPATVLLPPLIASDTANTQPCLRPPSACWSLAPQVSVGPLRGGMLPGGTGGLLATMSARSCGRAHRVGVEDRFPNPRDRGQPRACSHRPMLRDAHNCASASANSDGATVGGGGRRRHRPPPPSPPGVSLRPPPALLSRPPPARRPDRLCHLPHDCAGRHAGPRPARDSAHAGHRACQDGGWVGAARVWVPPREGQVGAEGLFLAG